MRGLMVHARNNVQDNGRAMSAQQALDDYLKKNVQASNMPQGAQQGMAHPGQGGPARPPPNMGGMNPQFMSPAMANGLLPNTALNGSPHLMQNHTPSPASHQMQKQLSQQGSSSTASVNASPNNAVKRRRSTVKVEDDSMDMNMNGTHKVKQSPRVTGNTIKRQKNN